MRLREIQQILDSYLKDLKVTSKPTQNSGGIKISGFLSFKKAFFEIEKAGIFKDEISNIKSVEDIFLSVQDEFVVQKTIFDRFNSHLSQLRNGLTIVRRTIDELIGKEKSFSVSISLPEISNLKKMSEIFLTLEKIFDQLIRNDYVGGKVQLQNFDTGSFWLEFVADSLPSISIFSSLVYLAVWYKRESIRNKILVEEARSRKITNDIVEKLENQIIDQQKELMDAQIRKMAEDYGVPEDDKEQLERIKFCMREVEKLIDMGLRFFPASNAPDEIKSVFPDFSKPLDELLDKAKEITENPSDHDKVAPQDESTNNS